jgi:hypothetical protein
MLVWYVPHDPEARGAAPVQNWAAVTDDMAAAIPADELVNRLTPFGHLTASYSSTCPS